MKKFFLLTVLATISSLGYAQTVELMVKKGEKGLYLEHTVAPKEGLYVIGRLYNVNAKSIAAYNHADFNKGLEIGQVLRIPLSDTNFTQRSTSGTPVYYKVMSGDGLFKVSVENNKVTVKNLKEWNSLASDNIQEGANLIIGFLISKDMPGYLANNRLKKQELAKQQAELEKALLARQQDSLVATGTASVVKAETVNTKPVVMDVVMDDTKKSEADKPMNAIVKEEVKLSPTEIGYFRTSFEQQVRSKPVSKNSTVTSGIFKTTSGWQDAKYYLLIDGVTPGTIIKVINPDNNKVVYAKVLGEMNGIRQNQGLDIRISNAAASALAIREEDKFVVKVNY